MQVVREEEHVKCGIISQTGGRMFFGKNKEKALPKADTEKKQLSIEETLNYLGEKYIKVTKNEIILRGTDCYCRSEGLKWAVAKGNDGGYWIYTAFREDSDFVYLMTDGSNGYLCGSLEELRNLSVKEIEGHAYNIYMTFAR